MNKDSPISSGIEILKRFALNQSQRDVFFVRTIDCKVSVGIFACEIDELYWLVDEICNPGECEFKYLSSGGFIFGGEFVLHERDREEFATDLAQLSDCQLTDSWMSDSHSNDGDWFPIEVYLE